MQTWLICMDGIPCNTTCACGEEGKWDRFVDEKHKWKALSGQQNMGKEYKTGGGITTVTKPPKRQQQ